MIMCVLLCYPVSIHMSQVQATGRPISSLNFDLVIVTLTFKILLYLWICLLMQIKHC